MALTFIFLIAFLCFYGEIVSCQKISEIISTQPQLSNLATQLKSFPSLAQQFDTVDNFTFLAPSNKAISAWLTAIHSQDDIRAMLEYHLLNGTFLTQSLTNTPQFIPTSLTNVSYSNVTGGQRVEALRDGDPRFVSALNTTSKIEVADIIATGGIVQIIDTVLEIPFGSVETINNQNLSYFIEIGNEAGFLDVGNEINHFMYTPDLTWFTPNSAQALVDFNATGFNSTTLGLLFDYHCIDQLIYSTGFVNGTQLTTAAGVPVLVTLKNDDIYVNNAKITARDNLVVNGVFHVIDDILNPNNITRPSFATNNSTSSTSPPANPPVNSESPLSNSSSLKTSAKVGIWVGTGAALIGIIWGIILLCRRKRERNSVPSVQSSSEAWPWNISMKPAELSSNPLHELAQLETRERAVELPAKHEYLFEIGRAL